jgi:hypothetical protein
MFSLYVVVAALAARRAFSIAWRNAVGAGPRSVLSVLLLRLVLLFSSTSSAVIDSIIFIRSLFYRLINIFSMVAPGGVHAVSMSSVVANSQQFISSGADGDLEN